MASSIGSLDFVVMQGTPALPSKQVETIEYSNSEYARYRSLAKKAPVFSVRTVVNVADLAEGYTVFQSYLDLKTAGLQTLILNDHNYHSGNQLKVKVIGVVQEKLTNVLTWCGSLDDTDGARLVANWTLQFKAV